jgi:hypothetical protein
MAPDRRALFEAAFGALMIRAALPRPAGGAPAGPAEPSHNSMSSSNLANGAEPTPEGR